MYNRNNIVIIMDILQLQLRDFLMLFLSILIGATPFVLIGVIFSSFLENLVDTEKLLKIVPKNRWLAPLVMSFIGFVFPVCECGNVPLARRLIRKGVSPAAVISFLLAAPILNPITITSTLVAFGFWPELVVARFVMGFVIAYSIGVIFTFSKNPSLLLKEEEKHLHDEACKPKKKKQFKLNFNQAIAGIPREFLEMMSVLIIGAGIAAFVQITIPREALFGLAGGELWMILMMMVLALVISVCSSVDAFIALAYANTVGGGALLAFLVFGPMIDLKSLALMRTIFNTKTLVYLSSLVAMMTILAALIFNYF
ncbi:MAG: permease [Candidatus Altimarinota bacterium]